MIQHRSPLGLGLGRHVPTTQHRGPNPTSPDNILALIRYVHFWWGVQKSLSRKLLKFFGWNFFMFSLWIKVLGTNVFVNSDYWGQISGIRLNLLICFRLSLHLTHPSPTFGTICQYLVPFGTIQHLWHQWHQAVQLAPFGTILKPFSMLWYHLAPFFTIGSR